ncbi:MAG: N-acetylmuramoyl-L-alanine amidase [Chitinophagaceae bacterium]|nr:N-acetylmuramoyl-L-alanine amidase [Chitinophagaceae bacterium]
MKNLLILLFLVCHIVCFSQEKTGYVRSGNHLPMLGYGLGQDRLGGAKMGYIDSNVILNVIDSTRDLYHVQLSKYHTGYISKNDVSRDSLFKPKPFYLTGSYSVRGGDNKYDTLNISMDERLPYKSWMEISPSRVMLEIYGVQSNTNWITQLQTLKEIKNVYYEQSEDDVVKITIELKHHQHWGYSISYVGKALQIRVKQQPKILDLKKLTVAIDPGHGGTNLGADGLTTKVLEKDYTLKISQAVEKYLTLKGVKVIMTRTADTTFDNKDRAMWLQGLQPDLQLSIHLNSSDRPEVQGVSTYYKHIGFRPLSLAILKQMIPVSTKEYGNIGSFNFTLNAPTDYPNALLEVAFLSNIEEEKKILSPKFHKAIAAQVYKGLVDFLKQAQ